MSTCSLADVVSRLASLFAGRTGRRNLFLVVALVLAALRGFGLATAQLPFNGWDEIPHLAAAFHVYKFGHMPAPTDRIDPELIPFIEAHPLPTRSAAQLAGIPTHVYPGDDPRCSAEPLHKTLFKQYQAQHGPLFYHLMAALLQGSDPASLLAWADTGRLLNIGCLLGFLALWNLILRRLTPPGPLGWLPEGVTLLLISFSYVSYSFIRFANDGLSLFLSSLALAWYVVCLKPAPTPDRYRIAGWGLLGGLTGLAVLAKATALPLAPVFGCLLGWRLLRAPGKTRWGLALLAFAAGYGLSAGPYHLRFLLRYGQLTGMQEAIINARHGVTFGQLLAALPALDYGLLRNHFFYYCTAHVGGWAVLTSPDWMNLGFKTLMQGSLLCLGLTLVFKHRRQRLVRFVAADPELPLLFAASAAGLLYHAVHSLLAWGICSTNPWYAMVSLPAFFALLCLGPGLLSRHAAVLWLVGIALLCNVAYLDGTYNSLLYQETGTSNLYVAMKIAETHHRLLYHVDLHTVLAAELLGLFGLLTLALEGVAVRRPDVAPAHALQRGKASKARLVRTPVRPRSPAFGFIPWPAPDAEAKRERAV